MEAEMDLQGILLMVMLGLCANFAWRFFKFKKIRRDLPMLINNGAVFIDVRTPEEFGRGNRAGSINIPLSEVNSRLDEIDRSKMIILCCASGSRSSLAARLLKRTGFKHVIDAGPWKNTLV
jgi:phage shock protein E